MRHPAKLFLTGAALLVATSCNSDSSVAPSRGTPPSISGSPALAARAKPTTVDFVIPAAGGRATIFGLYTLDFPANAVCDPNAQDSRAGYAAASWDAPCTAATSDITVHATLQWSHNRLWVDFSPSLRFDPNQVVTISTSVMAPLVRYYADAANHDISNGRSAKWGILFSSAINGRPIDDAVGDASLRTTIDFATGKITRRVKHFTGYNLFTGETCIVAPEDIFCVEGHPDHRP